MKQMSHAHILMPDLKPGCGRTPYKNLPLAESAGQVPVVSTGPSPSGSPLGSGIPFTFIIFIPIYATTVFYRMLLFLGV
jgi:hypothetical protein